MDKIWAEREKIVGDKARVLQRLAEAIGEEESYELIVGRKNTADSVKKRINLLQEILLPE